jgi:hypothetical protein
MKMLLGSFVEKYDLDEDYEIPETPGSPEYGYSSTSVGSFQPVAGSSRNPSSRDQIPRASVVHVSSRNPPTSSATMSNMTRGGASPNQFESRQRR